MYEFPEDVPGFNFRAADLMQEELEAKRALLEARRRELAI